MKIKANIVLRVFQFMFGYVCGLKVCFIAHGCVPRGVVRCDVVV